MKKTSTNTRGQIEKGQKNTSTVCVKSKTKSTFKCFINMQEEILVLIVGGRGGAVTDDPVRAEVTGLFFLLQPSLKRSAGNRWPTTAGTGAEPADDNTSPRDFSQGFLPGISWGSGQSTHSQTGSCPRISISTAAMVHSSFLPKVLLNIAPDKTLKMCLKVNFPQIWDELASQENSHEMAGKKMRWS